MTLAQPKGLHLVGSVPLAKGYGNVSLYAIRRAAKESAETS